ncbi:hypothetical protein D9M70_545250 [compost metagenome]
MMPIFTASPRSSAALAIPETNARPATSRTPASRLMKPLGVLIALSSTRSTRMFQSGPLTPVQAATCRKVASIRVGIF